MSARTVAGPTRASAMQRRLAILEAALRIMARDGLRAVSHRSVAAEAGVPLAATTYYFSDLEDLIAESFLHWSQAQRRVVGDFLGAALGLVERAAPEGREVLVPALADAAAGYVMEQARTHRADRALEFAFLHEAARLPRLRTVVHERQLEDRRALERFHATLGSADPALDAQVSHSLLLGLEKSALLDDGRGIDRAAIRVVLEHHLRALLARAG
ncbi:MAG: TetR family transcriptional regulator [Steroidobacteraceae bacterium]